MMLEQIQKMIAQRRAVLLEQLEALDRVERDLRIAFQAPLEAPSAREEAAPPATGSNGLARVAGPPEKLCAVCAGPFEPQRPWGLYCGRPCQQKAAKRRRDTRKTAPAEDLEPLPDQRERPFCIGAVEDQWLRETLRPPALEIELPAQ